MENTGGGTWRQAYPRPSQELPLIGALPPFSAPEVPSTGQPRPFPEILHLLPSADSALPTNEKLE